MSSASGGLRLLALMAALVMLVAACGSEPEAAEGGAGDDGQAAGGGTELLVEAYDFRFEVEGAILPDPGEDVTVRLVNEGEAPHTFSSEEVDLDVTTDPGGKGEGSFTVPESGTVDFQCNIHTNMKLTLTTGESVTTDTGGGESEDGSGTEGEGESTGNDDYDY